MPYAEPTSPIPISLTPSSSLKSPESSRRTPTHNDSNSSTKPIRSVSAPMPGIPRRSSSTSSSPATAAPTSRSTSPTSPTPPRHSISAAVAGTLASMRSVDTLPRRTTLSPSRPVGSLGLHLFGNQGSASVTGEGQLSDSNDALTTPKQEKRVPFPSSSTGQAKPESHSSHSPPKPTLSRRPSNRERGNSASSLHTPVSPTSPSTPFRPSSMVRKKSGELVKPSLKQRSLSTPDLGRGKDNGSGDELRERTKSVRFDDLGLESVVLFLRGQRPTDVSKASLDTNSNDTPTETEDDNDTDLSDLVHFRTRRGGGSRPETGKEIQLHAEVTVPRLRLDFGPGTQGLLKNERVILERVEMQNGSPLAMRGTVLVRNLAFQKWVAIRFTLDHWQTTSEVICQHVSHIPAGTTGDEGWDRFSFNIRLEDYRRKIEERLLHLCVRFSIDGHEWWDSNNGENYRFSFKRASIRKPRAAPTPLRGGGSESSILPPLRVPRSADRSNLGWLFPRKADPGPIERVSSPMQSPPPAAAFQPPETPDVHSHLQLKRYCAPSPPKSPPQKLFPAAVLTLAPKRGTAASYIPTTATATGPQTAKPPTMTLVSGRPSTVMPSHDRSHSWSGHAGSSWQTSSPDKLSASDNDEVAGDATPRAARARSPETRTPIAGSIDQISSSPASATPTSSEDEKDRRGQGLAVHRSTGDLRSLMNASTDTPPSSNLSSPPTPSTLLPGPMSPAASMSTGDSSPVNTNNAGSPEDTGPMEERGRTLNAATYQEFLDKFCFFKSPPPVLAPLEDSYSSVQTFSGFSSPSIYGYFGSEPPRGITPTPPSREQSTEEAACAPAACSSGASASGATPRGSPPIRSPAPTAYAPLPWTPPSENGPPSLRAA